VILYALIRCGNSRVKNPLQHEAPAFLPWHREFVNRFEGLLHRVDPTLSLHYWNVTQHPTQAPQAGGGTFNIFDSNFMGSATDEAGEPWKSNNFYNPNMPNRSNDPDAANNNPFDPPAIIRRSVRAFDPNNPGSSRPDQIEAALNESTYPTFRLALETIHNRAHNFIRGTLSDPHTSFRDPFVFLLHSNIDRLFAQWQLRANVDDRVDPDLVYGSETNTRGSGDVRTRDPTWGILSPVEPWAGALPGDILNVRPTRPWAPPENEHTLPENRKNHKHWTIVKPPCYDTNPAVIQVLNLDNTISFNQVPSGETTVRAARFRFLSCYPLTFKVTSGPDAPYSVFSPSGAVGPLNASPDSIWTEALLWFSFTGESPNTSAPPSTAVINVSSVDHLEDFTFRLTGYSIPRPNALVVLVLDQSGSMNDPAGTTGLKRIDALKYAAKSFVETIPAGNSMGLIRFDTTAYAVDDATYGGLKVTDITSESVFDTGRRDARNAVNRHVTNTAGRTSIGAGIQMARQLISNAVGTWTVRAMIVFTDGLETATPHIADVMGDVDAQTFAVGLGNPQQINTAALNAITNATGGYTYITGTLGPSDDDFFKLTKYFQQILAGVTNTQIVKDPRGFLPRGGSVKIPFYVADVDIEYTVVLDCDLPALDFFLISPTGRVVSPASATAGSGINFADAGLSMHYRFNLPITTAPSFQEGPGTWVAILKIDEKRFKKYCSGRNDDPRLLAEDSEEDSEEDRSIMAATARTTGGSTPCTRGGIRYNVSMFAWSNLRLAAAVHPAVVLPGGVLKPRARLEEFDVPFGLANVTAVVTRPDGTKSTLVLTETETGSYESAIVADMPGVYHFHFVAKGNTTRGLPFTREAVLTASAFAGANDTVPGTGGGGSGTGTETGGGGGANACCLMKSLLKNQSVYKFLKKNDLDPQSIMKSVEECCHAKADEDSEGRLAGPSEL
jgi:Common central domain of tyrosinase/von Willebrand factor type A domain